MAKKSAKAENILILGLGGMGYYLAKRLSREGYSITAIEADAGLIRYADSYTDARFIKGDAMNMAYWKEAGAAEMEYLIAVTNNDAVNMVSAMVAHRFGIQKKIVRIRSLDFGNPDSILSDQDLNIDLLVHPEELTAQEIARLVKIRAGNEIIDIAEEQIQVMATRIEEGSSLAYMSLKDLSLAHPEFPFRVIAATRGISTIIPGGDYVIRPQDQLFFMVGKDDLPRLMEITGLQEQHLHRVMIVGGGLLGSRIAELLGKSFAIKLIERDEQLAGELTYRLPHAEILQGDGSDVDVLSLAGLLHMDTFITTTGDNEINIMSSLLAKHLMSQQKQNQTNKMRKTIALVNKEDYLVLAASIGADIALNKKILAGNEILKFIRRGELLSVAHLHGFDAEVVELMAAPNAPITKKPLSQLDPYYHGKIIVGAIFQNGQWEIAVGDTHIQDNDRVIVVSTSLQLKEVQSLFGV
ncbi:MAG: Trk system potassium transporter TrkA [Desulfohalobiaceae bacterium]|nr:Trk system potassium transporter TrkA [Desulfohalobiaceae bacterium]